jgi:predicted DsbA family dithiol-disulfide isomerase
MRIDVFHDTVCPWCRIGKAHLKQALAQWDAEPVEIHYHTFFLNPSILPGGYNFREYMTAKGGGQVPMEDWFARPREIGARAGLTFNFEKIEHAPNSLLSHRLIYITPAEQKEAMIDALYAAYFEHGQNIGDVDVLVSIAQQQGLAPRATRDQLMGDVGTQQVMDDDRQARELGIMGVPFFLFPNRLGFSGAEPPNVILRVLKAVHEQD